VAETGYKSDFFPFVRLCNTWITCYFDYLPWK